jgi:hypothetical protein
MGIGVPEDIWTQDGIAMQQRNDSREAASRCAGGSVPGWGGFPDSIRRLAMVHTEPVTHDIH